MTRLVSACSAQAMDRRWARGGAAVEAASAVEVASNKKETAADAISWRDRRIGMLPSVSLGFYAPVLPRRDFLMSESAAAANH